MLKTENNNLAPSLLILLVLLFVIRPAMAADTAAPDVRAPEALRFEIRSFAVEGATLLKPEEIDAAVAPYVGKNKDFSDVEHALEAIEALYAKHGYSAVHVLLPEQQLENGRIRFKVIESRFSNVTVKGNKYFSKDNVLNALPSVRPGAAPRSKQIARELRLANENPARNLSVTLKGGARDQDVDADISVKDQNPGSTQVTFDNTGTPETGKTRLGLAYTYANLFNADHVASLQVQTSPQHTDRSQVVGASYKIPRYSAADSFEFFAGYSNVNSVTSGLQNFKGGGTLFSARNNRQMGKIAGYDPRLAWGIDWRDFRKIEVIQQDPTLGTLTAVEYNEIVVTPLVVNFALQKKEATSETDFSLGLTANIPMASKGKKKDFDNYVVGGTDQPGAKYKILHYGASYVQSFSGDWQTHVSLNGQWTVNSLILGEQFRLGGMDGVRGFSEGSESGDNGQRISLEGYTPAFGLGGGNERLLIFADGGHVSSRYATSATIASVGFGIRMTMKNLSLRADAGRIEKAGTDPLQKVGKWRGHFQLSAQF